MCGRYEFLLTKKELMDYYEIEEVETDLDINESVEVFPSQICPVILENKRLATFKWGLDEAWAKRAIINSRLETADQKKTTAQAFAQRRCIIPISAFFEWNSDKDKIKIGMADPKIISLAGLFNYYQTEEGQTYAGFSILTKDANPQMKAIHDRMPVILPETFIDRYLDMSSNIVALKKSLLNFDQEFITESVI